MNSLTKRTGIRQLFTYSFTLINLTNTSKKRLTLVIVLVFPLLLFEIIVQQRTLPVSGKITDLFWKKNNNNISHSRNAAAIATLVTNSTKDVKYLCNALISLANLPDESTYNNNNNKKLADVLIFHENLSKEQMVYISNCTKRNVTFPHIGYSFNTSFPNNFDYINEEPNFMKRDNKWSYQQMIRFWITKIWDHPAITPYETIMRIDSDSCFEFNLTDDPEFYSVPYLPSNNVVYRANFKLNDLAIVTEGFPEFVHEYVRTYNINIQNKKWYKKIPLYTSNDSSINNVPSFYNNFEITRVNFMKRADVKAFHYALTEQEPFGVFRQRWGDAIERYATMSIFASRRMIVGGKGVWGYNHGYCYV